MLGSSATTKYMAVSGSLVRRPSGLEAFGRTAKDTLAFILADASSAAGDRVRWSAVQFGDDQEVALCLKHSKFH